LLSRERQAKILPFITTWCRRAEGLSAVDAIRALGQVMLLREKAVAAFPALTDHGELLPLECPDADLWVFNALRLIDAVDENASTLVRFSSGRILNIERHVFHPDRVQDVEVFKLPQMPRGWLYVTDDFVSRAASAGLRGVGFEQVWEQEG